MKLGTSIPIIGRGLRKLLLASALLIPAVSHSQTVIMNNDPSATGQCMGSNGYLPPAHFTYSGPGTVATWVTNAGGAFSQLGGTGPYTYGCYPNQFTGYYFVTNGAGSATTTANYYGSATVYALNSSGCVMAQKTITIYPAAIELTGQVTGPGGDIYQSGSFNMGGTWATGATYYNWAISYSNTGDDYTIISGQGTNHVTIAPQPWAPFNVNVVMNGYFQPAGDPCNYDYPYGRATAQRAPFASYDNSGNYLCSGSQLHVNVYDHSGTNYPSAPTNSNYRHFTYQWYRNGGAVSTAKDFDPASYGTGAYYCTVSQYKWNGSTWAYETQKNSNTINVIAENAGTISYLDMNGINMNISTPYLYSCNSMIVTPHYTGTPVSYSFFIFKDIGMTSVIVYSSPTISGTPSPVNIQTYESNFSTTSYHINYNINYGCSSAFGSGTWGVNAPAPVTSDFTIKGFSSSSPSSPVLAYNCDAINFQQTASGSITQYSLQFLNGGTSVYYSGAISGSPSSTAFDLRTSVSSYFNANTGYNYFDPAQNHSGIIEVKYGVYNGCTWSYKSMYVDLHTSSTPDAGFTINGTAANPTTAQLVYNCNAISFAKTSANTFVSYKVELIDNTLGTTVYSSGDVVGTIGSSIDLRNVCTSINSNTGCSYLDPANNHTGVYKVQYTVNNGCTSDVKTGLINVVAPATANADFSINGVAANPTTAQTVYNCNAITMAQSATGPFLKYQVDIIDNASSTTVYTSGIVTGTLPATIDLRNVCTSVNSNTGCSYLDPANNHTGVYKIQYTVYNGCTSDIKTGLINVVAPAAPDAGFTVNGSALNNTTPLDLFNCNNITFTQTSANAYLQYQVDIIDPATSTTKYSTGMVTGTPGTLDLRNLCALAGSSAGCDYLDPANGHTGNYKIQYTVFNGCINDVKSGLINVIAPPPANATFTINSSATSPTTPVDVFNCNAIQFAENPTGVLHYQIEILQSGFSLYNSGVVTGAPAATLDLRNLCSSVNSNSGCSTLSTATGIFEIRYSVFNGCVTDVKSGLVNVIAPPAANASFKVNGQAVNTTTAVNVYNCHPITFAQNASTTGFLGYQVEVLNNTGLPVYNSGYITATPPASFDLRNMCATINSNTNCDYLDPVNNHTGVYQVRYTVFNGCVNDIQTGLINIMAPPSSSMSIQTNARRKPSNQSVVYTSASTNVAAPDTVGPLSTTFILNSNSTTTASICSYTYSLEQYSGGTWVPVGPATTSLSNCASTTPVTESISINDLGPYDPITGDPFFYSAANAPTNSVWRMKVDLTNDCATNSYYAVFVINRLTFKRDADEENAVIAKNADRVQFAPVPFKNSVSATITLSETSKVSMKVYTMDGRLVNEMKETEMQAGQQFQTIQTDSWASGIYFYQCTIGKEVFTGKIVKE